MIPINAIEVVNGPGDVFAFAATSQITSCEFRSGSLHLEHSKDESWSSVKIDTADQQATFWFIGQIGGQWYAAGMERLRPTQRDKPEGSDPTGFIAGFVEGRNFGPFNGHTFQVGERVGVMVVQGDTRLNVNSPLRERSLVVEMAYPPNGQVLWTEGEQSVPETPAPPSQPPPQPDPTWPGDLRDVLNALEAQRLLITDLTAHVAMKTDLAELATKQDLASIRQQIIEFGQSLVPHLPSGLAGLFGRR